jgi:hypothetical protein
MASEVRARYEDFFTQRTKLMHNLTRSPFWLIDTFFSLIRPLMDRISRNNRTTREMFLVLPPDVIKSQPEIVEFIHSGETAEESEIKHTLLVFERKEEKFN